MTGFLVELLNNWWVNYFIWVVAVLVLFNVKLSRKWKLVFVGLAVFSGLYFIL